MTRKIVSEMTYNVSMGTLNPTIPYHTHVVHLFHMLIQGITSAKEVIFCVSLLVFNQDYSQTNVREILRKGKDWGKQPIGF